MGRQRNEDTVSLFRAARSFLFAHLPSAVVISPCMKKLQRIKNKRKRNKSSSWIMNIANLRRRMRPWLHQQSAVQIASAAAETKKFDKTLAGGRIPSVDGGKTSTCLELLRFSGRALVLLALWLQKICLPKGGIKPSEKSFRVLAWK